MAQMHGAIGKTRGYVFHHFTPRLWVWRQEWLFERPWTCSAGGQVVGAGREQLWQRGATGLVATS